MRDVLVASSEPDNQGSRTEAIPQDRVEDIEVPVGDWAGTP
jgi:hypothetical protein